MALTVALLGVRVLVLVAALDATLGRAVDAVALRMVSSDHGKSRCQRKRTELAAAGALSEARPVRWCALWQRRLRLKPRRGGSSGLAWVRTAVRQDAAACFVLGYRTSGHWQNRVIPSLLCQRELCHCNARLKGKAGPASESRLLPQARSLRLNPGPCLPGVTVFDPSRASKLPGRMLER